MSILYTDTMRGKRPSQTSFVSLIDVQTLIAADHPIRTIKRMCDEVLVAMSEHFDEIYAADGAPSIPPETLLKGKVLQALYTVRSDRQLCARLQTYLMFRWFVDLPLDEAVFDASTYSKNQSRLLTHEVADLFFAEIVELARKNGWVSDDHFSVDGTLIEAWASMKSFRPKGDAQGPGSGNAWMDFKGDQHRNDTHASTTDPEAKLMRKGPGKEARLCFGAHATMENRNGLCVLPTLAHAASQKVRKRIEEIFGSAKTIGCFRKSRYRGVERTHAQGQYVVAAWNLVRMA